MNKSETPIVIDNASVASGVAYKVTNLVLSPQYWHKVIVNNADTEPRDLVLSTLMMAVRPHDFIPVDYKVEGDQTVSFLIKNCGQALMQFCWMHLTIPHPDESKNRPPFRVKLVLCDKLASQYSVSLKPNIVKILKRRYDRSKKRLNLDQFHQDPELSQFFHLSQPKLLYFVLHLSRDLQIEHLKLSNNHIESLNPFEAMCNEKCLKGLCGVDLSYNKIKLIEELNYLKMFPIRKLNLDGNPICNDYTNQEYMKAVMKHLPNLYELDDCNINKLGVLPFQRNFMCSQSGHELVDRFLEHYFNLYDSPDRSLLEGMYHRQAMFSLTQQYLADQNSTKTTKIMSYKKYARNIKSLTDFSKSDLLMFVGSQMISKIFSTLPPTEHDPHTFTVDLTKFEGCMLVLTITGIYKHLGTSLKGGDEMYDFMRTFILIRINDEEYKIINDLMNVTNAMSLNESAAFQTEREPTINYIHVPVAKETHEVEEMLEAFVVLTNLKREWARKCLMECEFDLKKSLNLFVTLYKEDKLPQRAFNPEESKPQSFTFPTEAKFAPTPVKNIPTLLTSPKRVSVSVNNQAPAGKRDSVQTTSKDEDAVVSRDKSMNGSDRKTGDSTDPSGKNGTESRNLDRITDKLVKKALTIPIHCPSKESKTILLDAANSVLSKYKNDVWYHSLIGIEFYKHRLLEEGRNFLAQSKAVLSTDNYEKLNSDYLLFEIEYGDSKLVDEIIKKKILIESVDSVLEFVLNRVPNISRRIARTLLWRMAHYKLLSPDLKKIINANKKFELVYGSTENLEKIIKLEEEYFGATSKSKTDARRTRANTRSSRSPIKSSNGEASRSPHRKKRSRSPHRSSRRSRSRSPPRPPKISPLPQEKHSRSPARTNSKNKPIPKENSENKKGSSSPVVNKETKSTEPTENNAEELIENVPEPPLWMTFEEFSMEIVKPIGVHVPKFHDPDIKKIQEFTGTNTILIRTCEAALKKCENHFSVVSVIFKKYWERNMVSNIRGLLAKAKDFPEKGLVNNLIVLFKIRMQLQQRKQSDTLQKIHLHVNKIPFKDVINFFETISTESGDDVNEIFESCLANGNINEALKRIIILKYKAFCNNSGKFEKYRKDTLFQFYLSSFNHMLFNYDEVLDLIKKVELPPTVTECELTKLRRNTFNFLAKSNYSLEKCAQVILYFKEQKKIKYIAESQSVFDYCTKLYESQPSKHANKAFQLFLIMTVLDTPSAKKCTAKRLQKWKPAYDLNANLVCTIAEIYIIRMNVHRARLELMSYINDSIILDTDVQRCLFEYFRSWKRKYNVDMLPMLLQKSLNVGENQAELYNQVECMEVLLSSDDDENKRND